MKRILLLIALLGFTAHHTIATATGDTGAKKFSTGQDFLKQQQFQEARKAFEADRQQHPTNALVHFNLGEACRGLKDWACAEEHYQTSLELDPKSSVAQLAIQRGRKVEVWRLLDEGKQALTEPNTPHIA